MFGAEDPGAAYAEIVEAVGRALIRSGAVRSRGACPSATARVHSMGSRKLGGALVALVCALAAAGCGGSSGSSSSSGISAGDYVKAICTAVGPFEKDVAARSNALNSAKLTSPQQGKKAVQGFLNSVSADTDKALTKLQAAGTPNVDNGQKISTTIVAAFKELKTAIGTASDQAKIAVDDAARRRSRTAPQRSAAPFSRR